MKIKDSDFRIHTEELELTVAMTGFRNIHVHAIIGNC